MQQGQFVYPGIVYLEAENIWWAEEAGPFVVNQDNENGRIIDVISPYLKGEDVAVQAGGHCGWTAREFGKQFQTVYTFEPLAVPFLCLCLNNPGSNIIKLQACIGNRHELISMEQWSPNNSGASHVNDGMVHIYEKGAGSPFKILQKQRGYIPMLMIDDLSLKRCDFIQLDLEGYEHYALQGAAITISKYHPVLCVEQVWESRFGIDGADTRRMLEGWGYEEITKLNADVIYRHRGK